MVAASKKKPAKTKAVSPKPGARISAVIVAILGFILYFNTISHEYVYDDGSVITKNSLVTQGAKAIPLLFKTAYWYGLQGVNEGAYRPLPLTVFAVEWQLFPNNPAFGHFVNVML